MEICLSGNSPGEELSWWGVVLVGNCPGECCLSGESSWLGVVLVGNCPEWGIVLVGSSLSGELYCWGVVLALGELSWLGIS